MWHWRNDAENTEINYTLTHIHIENILNWNNISQILLYLNLINAAVASRRDFFQKQIFIYKLGFSIDLFFILLLFKHNQIFFLHFYNEKLKQYISNIPVM